MRARVPRTRDVRIYRWLRVRMSRRTSVQAVSCRPSWSEAGMGATSSRPSRKVVCQRAGLDGQCFDGSVYWTVSGHAYVGGCLSGRLSGCMW